MVGRCAVGPLESGVWTAAARLEAVIVTAAMDEAQQSAWCREQGLFPAAVAAERDRDADPAGGSPGESTGDADDRRRIKELERDLRRKEKALAETATLLVLSKKLEAIFQPEGEE